MCRLERIIEELKQHNLLVGGTTDQGDWGSLAIAAVCYDSRQAAPGTLFFCKGLHFREEYLAQALRQGAVAYVAEQRYCWTEAPCIQVSDIRKAMSVATMAFYGHPHQALKLVGITGTKGKTTTAYMLKNIIDHSGHGPCGLLSSIENFTGGQPVEAHLTTPESLELQGYFAQARDNGLGYLTMEVSSQAYKMARVFGMIFDLGLFLNIEDDHISPNEHKDFADYLGCKLEFIKNCRRAIINGQTREFPTVLATAQAHCQQVVTFGFDPGLDYCISHVQRLAEGFSFDLTGPEGVEQLTVAMPGVFNVENAAAAAVAGHMLGLSGEAIAAGLAKTQVRGRMNLFRQDGVTVVVDFAHNYLSFSRLFASLKTDYPNSDISIVFGCPGGKAYSRRKDLGTIAGQNASHIYLTADDPLDEEVTDICQEIAGYIQPFDTPYEIIPDRKTAVATAIAAARPGDVVVLAAKGADPYQKVKGQYVPYESDLTLAQLFLAQRKK